MWSFSTKQTVNSSETLLRLVVKVKLTKISLEGASSLIFPNPFYRAVNWRSVVNGAPLMAPSTPRLSEAASGHSSLQKQRMPRKASSNGVANLGLESESLFFCKSLF